MVVEARVHVRRMVPQDLESDEEVKIEFLFLCVPCSLDSGIKSADDRAPAKFLSNPTPYTLHPTPYTLHPTPYTLHPTPLHPIPYILHPSRFESVPEADQNVLRDCQAGTGPPHFAGVGCRVRDVCRAEGVG